MTEPTSKAEASVLKKISKWDDKYRPIGERIHQLILEAAPSLTPKTFYGMPGYAKDGNILVYIKVDEGYLTFGLSEFAHFSLDSGATSQLMPAAWFLTDLDEATEKEISAIVSKAVPE